MMDVIVVNLVREGINKHRARELAEHFIKHMAQPEQEPVAWRVSPRYEDLDGYFDFTDSKDVAETLQQRGWEITPLCATPQQRTWVGLTNDDWDGIFGDAMTIGEAIKVTEAKLKEKNT